MQQQCLTARAAALLPSSRRAATTTAFSLSTMIFVRPSLSGTTSSSFSLQLKNKIFFLNNNSFYQRRSIVTITKTTAASSSESDQRKEEEQQEKNKTTTSMTKKNKNIMIPRKAAISITPKARTILKQIINITKSQGILLKYEISSQHALRMAFKFVLIKDISNEININTDEGISLEVLDDGITPKSPMDSYNDNLPKLYISQNAFMKVLGGTLDVDINVETGDMIPRLIDREGHDMDPNA
jgi:hypothetical protein